LQISVAIYNLQSANCNPMIDWLIQSLAIADCRLQISVAIYNLQSANCNPMIDWLIQSSNAHPSLRQGIAPIGLLSELERASFTALKTEKRRRDWLLGRWTAKHLLQASIERQTGQRPALDQLVVGRDPDGAPRIIAEWRSQIADHDPNLQSAICNLQSLSLSISHCRGRAFCALATVENIRVGADIERIEPREWQFVEDYFTEDEIAAVRRSPSGARDTLVTAIWSAKEAALKALRLGLTVDTRSVSCAIRHTAETSDWSGFDLVCDPRLLNTQDIPALTGWWRIMDGDVLTVVSGSLS
jgi:4'-phosphopantetheinyl transferase